MTFQELERFAPFTDEVVLHRVLVNIDAYWKRKIHITSWRDQVWPHITMHIARIFLVMLARLLRVLFPLGLMIWNYDVTWNMVLFVSWPARFLVRSFTNMVGGWFS